MENEVLINEKGVALLTLTAAIRERTAPAQSLVRTWLSLARNHGLAADVPARYRKALAWGCTDAEIRAIADALNGAVPWTRAAMAAGLQFTAA